MKFVKQKREDDCMSACLESLLGIEAPLFVARTWQSDVQEWMQKWGFAFISVDVYSMERISDAINVGSWPRDVYYIISGLGPRGRQHSCIGINDEIVWDPHPQGGGIEPPYQVEFILMRDS